jgi:hypothetical protein
MLRPDGLDEDEMDAYHRGISRAHRRRVEAEVTTLDGELVAHLTPEVSSGTVFVDAEAEDDVTSRIVEMNFVQPTRMRFEPYSASDMPFHRQFALRVTDCRFILELGRWVDCPVHYGPMWDFDRTGAQVTLVAHGWERQAFGVKWNPETFRRGTKKTDVIKALLAEAGFTNLGGIPDLDATLPEDGLTMTKADLLWPACVKLAESMNRHLFIPPSESGPRPTMRRLPDAPAFIFDERHLMAEPVVDRQARSTPNVFQVVGARPPGAKRRVGDVRELDPDHPDSKESLAFHDQPHRVLLTERNEAIKTQAEAEARAKRLRDKSERGAVDLQVDVLPFPHFEELDLVAIRDEVGAERIRMSRFSFGWGLAPTPLAINQLKKTSGRGRTGKHLGRGSG